MIPNITRGTRVVGLMTYLVKEGRANEHTEQHLVAGDHAIMARHGYAVLDVAAAREIGIALDTPPFFSTETSGELSSREEMPFRRCIKLS